MYLLEWAPVRAEREEAIRRFARRYGKTFARAGALVPEEALYVLASGVHELTCAHVRAGGKAIELEDVLVGCAVRLAKKEERWT